MIKNRKQRRDDTIRKLRRKGAGWTRSWRKGRTQR